MCGAAAALRFERPPDVVAFERRAVAFLQQREAENCLILGLCASLRGGRVYGDAPPYFAIVRGADVIGAAMRTPPFNLILAAGSDTAAIPLILAGLALETTDLTGVLGPKDLAARAVELWRARAGVLARLKTAERIYRLTTVNAPRFGPAAGWMRLAEPADRELLVGWFLTFAEEALGAGDLPAAKDAADRWITGRSLRLWIDGGTPVSMAGAGGPTPNGIRVSAVFTPKPLRTRGYASTLVATLSQAELSAGRKFCFLFTDLANPTSNKIYQDIGYEPVCDVDEYRFMPAG